MAGTLKNTSDKMVYGIIGNIPPYYHSSNLRDYFSQFIEKGGFECFHFRHRLETKRTEIVEGNPSSTSETQPAENESIAENDKPKSKTMCCIVKCKENMIAELVSMYHRKHWLDRKGDSIAALCFISRVKVLDKRTDLQQKYKTREEQKQIPEDREEFTSEDLSRLKELHPPNIMPNGNVGTTTKYFLQLIQACKLPPIIIKKLGLSFPRMRSNRRYGSVPLDYGGYIYHGPPTEEEIVKSSTGKELEAENKFISEGKTVESLTGNTSNSHTSKKGKQTNKGQTKTLHHLPKKRKEEEDNIEEDNLQQSESDSDDCEEWDRHEALHDDTANVERNKERLFEEEIELKWEKGGSGLVFYTDAQYWDEKEGDFDEKTADDWDVDMSEYNEAGTGDKDARDFITMRQDKRRRQGDEQTDFDTAERIGKFEKFTKGIGRKVMERQGWKEGGGLGRTVPGMADALDNEGQGPRDKTGLGYHGEKLERHLGVKRRRPEGTAIVASIYDNPRETDPAEPLRRRAEPHNIKYRHDFVKARDAETTKLPQHLSLQQT